MPRRLDLDDPSFDVAFARLLDEAREAAADVDDVVKTILADVRQRGDAAVVDCTRRYDRVELTPEQFRVTEAEIDQAVAACKRDTLDALALPAERIQAFHRRQLPQDSRETDAHGIVLGAVWRAVAAVGLYVPGGTASYPSSVLMNAVPAKVAGVDRLVMVVPTPDGVLNPLVLAAAELAGISEIYRIGGAPGGPGAAFGNGANS